MSEQTLLIYVSGITSLANAVGCASSVRACDLENMPQSRVEFRLPLLCVADDLPGPFGGGFRPQHIPA